MVETQNLRVGYDGREILHGISLAFEPGKITALVGPNGCGKSTLLKAMVRIIPMSGGSVTLYGEDAARMTARQLARRIAYLPQSRKAPDMSVLRMVLHGRFAYLSYPRRYREEDIRIAHEAIRWAGLEGMEEEIVSRLSGGMQQKAYIAMALCQDADVILMDEPTTYLDIAHQLRLMDMAKALAGRGKAVVMVLHDLSQALRTADNVCLMKAGSLAACGTPEEVYQSGMLNEVFGVHIERAAAKSGWHYFCDAQRQEE